MMRLDIGAAAAKQNAAAMPQDVIYRQVTGKRRHRKGHAAGRFARREYVFLADEVPYMVVYQAGAARYRDDGTGLIRQGLIAHRRNVLNLAPHD